MSEVVPVEPASEKPKDGSNGNSCGQLNLSWLNEAVMEAALETKNLSLTDIHHFHSSLRAAEEWGNLDQDCSERLHAKIETKEAALMSKLVKQELSQVAQRLQIYRLLKTHHTWEQVHYMADMHGQGAYIVMSEFAGLAPKDVKQGFDAFHAQMKRNNSAVPWTDQSGQDQRVRQRVQKQVTAKLCRTYRKLVHSLTNQETGGYDPQFLQLTILYQVEDLMALWGVTADEINLSPKENKKEQEEEDKILGEKTDDEDEDQEEDELDGTFRAFEDDEDYSDGPAGRY